MTRYSSVFLEDTQDPSVYVVAMMGKTRDSIQTRFSTINIYMGSTMYYTSQHRNYAVLKRQEGVRW